MGLFTRALPALFPKKGAGTAITKAAAPLATKSVPLIEFPADLFWLPKNSDAGDTPISVRRAFKVFALAYACMRYRGVKLIEPPVWIAEESDDGEAMLEGEHALSELLEQPNPDMDMADFLYLWSLYLDYSGAVLIVLNRDRTGRVGSMYPYARDEFSVRPADGRLFGRFGVNTLSGYREFGPDDVIYDREPGTENIMSVVAPLEAALEHVNIGQNLRTAIRALMRNMVNPSLIARTAANLGDDTFERLSKEVRANWGGVTNQGKAITLEQIEEAIIREPTLKNLALGDVNDDVEAAVCQVFQLHPLLVGAKVGMSANSGFADSVGPATDLFYDVCAFPRWKRIERKFTRALLRPIDDNPRRFIRFDLSQVRALTPDLTEKVTQATGAKDFWTEAEQRAHTGKDGGSDELPSDRAARMQEEMRAAGGGEDETDTEESPREKQRNRIIDLVRTETGFRATVQASSNGNGKH